MNKNRIYIFIFFFFMVHLTVFSQTDIKLDRLYKQLKVDKKKIVTEFITYKHLPNDINSIIYVIPVKTEEVEGEWWSADILVVKLSTQSGEILKFSIFKSAIQSDAVELHKIWIDSAPYNIKENRRAFGIRLDYSNNSFAAGFNVETLLLVEEKDSFFCKILEIDVSKNVVYGSGDCENTEICNQKSIIVIDKVNSNQDYYNIIEKIHIEHYFLNKDCKDGKKELKNFNNVFQYKDGFYICNGQRKEGW